MVRGYPTRVALTALLLAAGCLTPRHYPAPNLPPSSRLVPADPIPEHATEQPVKVASTEGLPRPPRTVLAISGGGLYGAYTAGVLKGWSAAGTRPTFDAVTGVSTGALIATLAFLGPESDDLLENWYTTAKPGDVFRQRWLPALLWSDSVADSEPLRKRIEAVVNPGLLERVAREHAAGRRLYVGTTDLDTKRLVVWDMGAIAAGDAPDKLNLFRQVLLASCSIPGLLPPVPIDVEVDGHPRTELHVDGGVSASAFVPPGAVVAQDRGPTKRAEDTAVYVIVSGKVASAGRPVPRRLVDISEQSLDGVMRAQIRGDLQRISALARRAGAGFGYAAVPEDFMSPVNSVGLGPKILRHLFDEGYHFGAGGLPWNRVPPGVDAVEQVPPRTGIRLSVVDDRPQAPTHR